MSEVMTRDEFIDAYIERSPIALERVQRVRFGFAAKGLGMWIALPCDCGDRCCVGWGMMPNSLSTVACHCDLHLPSTLRYLNLGMRCLRCKSTWVLPHENRGMRAGLISRLVAHEIYCPVCHSRDPINHLTVESYEDITGCLTGS